jgi:putative component of membrane protein insertase Oxa1/YidC/SpoIIIJ protein YidD
MMYLMIDNAPTIAMTGQPLNWLAVGLIRGYRRFVSPHKGFRCAHHALHGDGSCSAFGLAVFQAYSFGRAVALIRERFRDCRHAYGVLTSQDANDDSPERAGRRKSNGTTGSLARNWDACACDALSALDCGTALPCDALSCDIGACSW